MRPKSPTNGVIVCLTTTSIETLFSMNSVFKCCECLRQWTSCPSRQSIVTSLRLKVINILEIMSLKSNPKLIHNLLIVLNVNVLNVRPVSVTRETRRGRRPYFVSHPFFYAMVGLSGQGCWGPEPSLHRPHSTNYGDSELRAPPTAAAPGVTVFRCCRLSHQPYSARPAIQPMVTTDQKARKQSGVDIPCVPVLWWPPVPGLLSTESQWCRGIGGQPHEPLELYCH